MNYGQLITMAKMGDNEAITELYTSTYKKAMYIANLNIKDKVQAEDIVQDSYVKAFASLDSLSNPNNFQAWLNVIITNGCKDYIKKKKPELFSDLSVSDDEGNESEPDFEDTRITFSPDAQTDKNTLKNIVSEMLDSLPEDQRMMITLYYMEDLGIKEIASSLSISEGTVKSRLSRAKDKIKQMTIDIEKRDGIKLHLIPVAALFGWFYKDGMESYAAESIAIPIYKGFESAGVAAGKASAANTAAKTVASGAVKTSMSIGAKAAIAVTAVVVAGGAVVGVTHHNQNAASSNESNSTVVSSVLENNEIVLSDEETAIFKDLYSLIGDETDDNILSDKFMDNRELIHRLSDEFNEEDYIFTGEKFEKKNSGTGVYIKDCNTLYVGELKNSKADGFGRLSRLNWDYGFASNFVNYYILPSIGYSEYSGEWKNGKANGIGTNFTGVEKYIDFDKVEEDVDVKSLFFDLEDTKIHSTFADNVANGEIIKTIFDNDNSSQTYTYYVNDGYIDPEKLPDGTEVKEHSNGRVYYILHTPVGEAKFPVSNKVQEKNFCTWDFNITEEQKVLNYDVHPVKLAYTTTELSTLYHYRIGNYLPYDLVEDFFAKLFEQYGDRLSNPEKYYEVYKEDVEHTETSISVSFNDFDDCFTFTYNFDGTVNEPETEGAVYKYNSFISNLSDTELERLEILSENASIKDVGDYYEISDIVVRTPDSFNFNEISETGSITLESGTYYLGDLIDDLGDYYLYDVSNNGTDYGFPYELTVDKSNNICEITEYEVPIFKTVSVDSLTVSKDCTVDISYYDLDADKYNQLTVPFSDYISVNRREIHPTALEGGLMDDGRVRLDLDPVFDENGIVVKFSECHYS